MQIDIYTVYMKDNRGYFKLLNKAITPTSHCLVEGHGKSPCSIMTKSRTFYQTEIQRRPVNISCHVIHVLTSCLNKQTVS